jgi:ribosomal protein L37E
MALELYAISQGNVGGQTFGELEKPIMEICRRMGRWTIEAALQAHPQANPESESGCPKCRGRFRIQRPNQRREWSSRLGRVAYHRAYGRCDRCGISGAPMDWALALPEQDISLGLLECVCQAAVVTHSFEDAEAVMKVHSMIDLSAKSIRAFAEGEGRRLAEARDRQVAAYLAHRFTPVAEASPGLLVVAADGGRVQTRQVEPIDRWKEDKIGVVYDAIAKPQPRVERGEYHGAQARTKTFVASLQPWRAFGGMLRLEAEQRGYGKATTRLFVADGARHIRELQKEHFHETLFILDWGHAAEHVSDCAKAVFGEGTEQARRAYEEYRDLLWNGQRDELIAELQKRSKRLGEPRDGDPEGSPRKTLYQNGYSYFPNNRDAIDYPTFRARGWPIGSGVAEASVKQFARRLKGSEKFWNDFDPQGKGTFKTGAEEMLALCALYHCEDGRWQRHWERRSQPRQWN